MSDHDFLRRWSKRKHETAAQAKVDSSGSERTLATATPNAVISQAPAVAPPDSPPALPDVESLTPESDFAPFMRNDVDGELRRKALKTLFQDPRFNVMDGMDVYIDDFSKPDPLPEGWLEKMNQVVRLGEYREPEKEAPEVPAATSQPPEVDAPAPLASAADEPPVDTAAREPIPPQVPES